MRSMRPCVSSLRRAVPSAVIRSMALFKPSSALKPWLEANLAKVPKGCKLGEALGYGLNHWDGLVRFLDDGRIEIDSNTVERSIRPLTSSPMRAAISASSSEGRTRTRQRDAGSLIGSCKLTPSRVEADSEP